MKKGIMLLAIALVSMPAFAQDCEDQIFYYEAAQQVRKLEKADLPPFFFYDPSIKESDINENLQDVCYRSSLDLFHEIEKTYKQHPNSYEAAFNYANALMCPFVMGSEIPQDDQLPKYNIEQAAKALNKIKGKRPNDVETWKLLYKIYEYQLFNNERAHDITSQLPVFLVTKEQDGQIQHEVTRDPSQEDLQNAVRMPTLDGMTLDEIREVYAKPKNRSLTKARLETVEKLLDLPQEQEASLGWYYLEEVLMCQALSLNEQADKSLEKLLALDDEASKWWVEYHTIQLIEKTRYEVNTFIKKIFPKNHK